MTLSGPPHGVALFRKPLKVIKLKITNYNYYKGNFTLYRGYASFERKKDEILIHLLLWTLKLNLFCTAKFGVTPIRVIINVNMMSYKGNNEIIA